MTLSSLAVISRAPGNAVTAGFPGGRLVRFMVCRRGLAQGANVPLSLTSDLTSVLKEAEDQMVLPLALPSQDNLKVLQIQSHFVKVVYEQSRLVNLFNDYSIPIVILKGTAAAVLSRTEIADYGRC